MAEICINRYYLKLVSEILRFEVRVRWEFLVESRLGMQMSHASYDSTGKLWSHPEFKSEFKFLCRFNQGFVRSAEKFASSKNLIGSIVLFSHIWTNFDNFFVVFLSYLYCVILRVKYDWSIIKNSTLLNFINILEDVAARSLYVTPVYRGSCIFAGL